MTSGVSPRKCRSTYQSHGSYGCAGVPSFSLVFLFLRFAGLLVGLALNPATPLEFGSQYWRYWALWGYFVGWIFPCISLSYSWKRWGFLNFRYLKSLNMWWLGGITEPCFVIQIAHDEISRWEQTKGTFYLNLAAGSWKIWDSGPLSFWDTAYSQGLLLWVLRMVINHGSFLTRANRDVSLLTRAATLVTLWTGLWPLIECVKNNLFQFIYLYIILINMHVH